MSVLTSPHLEGLPALRCLKRTSIRSFARATMSGSATRFSFPFLTTVLMSSLILKYSLVRYYRSRTYKFHLSAQQNHGPKPKIPHQTTLVRHQSPRSSTTNLGMVHDAQLRTWAITLRKPTQGIMPPSRTLSLWVLSLLCATIER
jgi:hypothetical protein